MAPIVRSLTRVAPRRPGSGAQARAGDPRVRDQLLRLRARPARAGGARGAAGADGLTITLFGRLGALGGSAGGGRRALPGAEGLDTMSPLSDNLTQIPFEHQNSGRAQDPQHVAKGGINRLCIAQTFGNKNQSNQTLHVCRQIASEEEPAIGGAGSGGARRRRDRPAGERPHSQRRLPPPLLWCYNKASNGWNS